MVNCREFFFFLLRSLPPLTHHMMWAPSKMYSRWRTSKNKYVRFAEIILYLQSPMLTYTTRGDRRFIKNIHAAEKCYLADNANTKAAAMRAYTRREKERAPQPLSNIRMYQKNKELARGKYNERNETKKKNI